MRKQEEGKRLRKEVNPTYSTTRKIDTDYLFLKKNKIIGCDQEGKCVDQIKILRSQILNKLEELVGDCLLVSSAGYGEGKTFIAINLAVCITFELDRTVLLVDADLRKPSIHRYFRYENEKGLSD